MFDILLCEEYFVFEVFEYIFEGQGEVFEDQITFIVLDKVVVVTDYVLMLDLPEEVVLY